MKTKLVAFCGAKESGKSTSAELFKTLVTDSKINEVAFAGHLKNTCSKVFNIDMKYFIDTKLKESELDRYIHFSKETILAIFQEFGVNQYDFDTHVRPHMGQVVDTPRRLLQYVGTNLLHPIDPLIHVNVTLRNIDPTAVTLVTDLRFAQEFDALCNTPGFMPVYVSNLKAELNASTDSHPSERGWQLFRDRCVILDNNGSLADLTTNLKALIESRIK